MSADYQMEPILAFVENGEFKKGNAPGGIIMWLNKTIDNIEIVRKGLYDNTKLANAEWNKYFNSITENIAYKTTPLNVPVSNPCATNPNYTSSTSQTIGPLLPIAWGQWDTYNNLCPNKGCAESEDRDAPTGCVATAMAMVVRYWEQPASKYNFSAMPIESGNIYVQKLMSAVDTSVNMIYDCAGSHPPSEGYFGGVLLDKSTAQYIRDGFTSSFFGYSSASDEEYQDDWQTVQTNLSEGWPVILAGYPGENSTWGYPTGDGHVWVCDGSIYGETNFCLNGEELTTTYLSFHMNWGWQEAGQTSNYNGWFSYNNWTIPQDGINYHYYDELAYNIHP